MRELGHSVRKSTQDSGNDGRRRAYSRSINDIRRSEYPQLDGTTYLDHAGTTPYSKSLMEEYLNDMKSNLFGNPHSQSPSSMLSTRRIESVRTQTLEFFKADPEFFDLIFVANATAAIKLVMEGMQGHDRGHGNGRFWYGYHCDSHTSLIGLRELASAGSKCFRSDQEVENWLSDEPEASSFRPHQTEKDPCIGLFAYPAQSNMNGRRLPLSWPYRIRSSNRPSHSNVYSLLDAAAFVSTAQLYLGDWKAAPDFTALSFYKIFGYPDLGALIVRKEAGHVLQKRLYFGGGTVHMVINDVNSPSEAWYARKTETLHEALEDGTPAFHSIIALGSALKVHRKVYGSMDNVSHHTCSLAKVLYQELSSLTHGNGVALCKIYKDSTSEYGDSQTQGPTIAFNVRDSSGSWIGKSLFEQLALVNNIQLRIGGVCNPGGIARFLDWAPSSLRDNFAQGLRCANGLDEIDGKPTGVIRLSLGAMSSEEDIYRLIRFMHLFTDKENDSPAVTRPETSAEEIVQLHTKPAGYRIQCATVHGNVVCPVATCKRLLISDNEMQEHLLLHRITTHPPTLRKKWMRRISPLIKRCQQQPTLL